MMKDGAPDMIRSMGLNFPKDDNILRGRSVSALRQDRYEAKEADAALRTVRQGETVLELGGGIGFMSTLMATRRAAAHVHVFEANPHLVPYIRAVHAANGVENATVHNAILGAQDGTADFYIRQNFLASSLAPVEGSEVLETRQIEMRKAATVASDLGADVLICDIEGAEADVLPLMDLSGLRAAIVELHPQWIGPDGVNKVFRAMMDAGLAYHARASTNKVVTFRRNWPLK